MYLRNVDSVVWDFCIMRQHGSVPNTCAKIFIIYTLQKSLFSSLVAIGFVTDVSLSCCTLKWTLNSKPWLPFTHLLFALLSYPRKLHVISPGLSR